MAKRQSENALLPDYKNSGGKGKEKVFKDKKNGRKRRFEPIIGDGIIISDEIKRIFEVSIKRYYHTAKQNPLSTTYNQMLKTFLLPIADTKMELKSRFSKSKINFQHFANLSFGMTRRITQKRNNGKEKVTVNMNWSIEPYWEHQLAIYMDLEPNIKLMQPLQMSISLVHLIETGLSVAQSSMLSLMCLVEWSLDYMWGSKVLLGLEQ